MAADKTESVLFFGEGGICKGVLLSDFEVLLDGTVGFAEFASINMRGAYVATNSRLQVKGLVFFTLQFDEYGAADPSWNLPFKDMLSVADSGPDLGAGPVKAVHLNNSRSGNERYAPYLWAPSADSSNNHFVYVRDTILSKGKSIGLSGSADPVVPMTRPVEPSVNTSVIPTVSHSSGQPPVASPVTSESEDEAEKALMYYRFKKKLDRLDIELKANELALKEERSQVAALQKQVVKLEEQLCDVNNQYQEEVNELKELAVTEKESIRNELVEQFEQRLDELQLSHQEQLGDAKAEHVHLEEAIGRLESHTAQLRQEKNEIAELAVNQYLRLIEAEGLSLTVEHPGAGQVTFSASQLDDYLRQPDKFAADKALVTVERYKEWFMHYQQPICRSDKGGKPCGGKVARIDVPRHFKPGDSDLCMKCQAESSIQRLVSERKILA